MAEKTVFVGRTMKGARGPYLRRLEITEAKWKDLQDRGVKAWRLLTDTEADEYARELGYTVARKKDEKKDTPKEEKE